MQDLEALFEDYIRYGNSDITLISRETDEFKEIVIVNYEGGYYRLTVVCDSLSGDILDSYEPVRAVTKTVTVYE